MTNTDECYLAGGCRMYKLVAVGCFPTQAMGGNNGNLSSSLVLGCMFDVSRPLRFVNQFM